MLNIYYAIVDYYAMKHWLMCNNKAWDKGDRALAVSCAKAWESLNLPVETIDALDGTWDEEFYAAFENIAAYAAIAYHHAKRCAIMRGHSPESDIHGNPIE